MKWPASDFNGWNGDCTLTDLRDIIFALTAKTGPNQVRHRRVRAALEGNMGPNWYRRRDCAGQTKAPCWTTDCASNSLWHEFSILWLIYLGIGSPSSLRMRLNPRNGSIKVMQSRSMSPCPMACFKHPSSTNESPRKNCMLIYNQRH